MAAYYKLMLLLYVCMCVLCSHQKLTRETNKYLTITDNNYLMRTFHPPILLHDGIDTLLI